MAEILFGSLGRWLATRDTRRTTLRAVTAGVLAAGLSALGLHEAAAKCNKEGKKCDKGKDCCSNTCKGGKCRCNTLREPCTFKGSAEDTCCGNLNCTGNACGQASRCSQYYGGACKGDCDCRHGLQCIDGACCAGVFGECLSDDQCCGDLFCSSQSNTCLPVIKLP